MSIMVGVGRAAGRGILIRKGDALQESSRLDVMVLDKTGTVTEGKPRLVHLECLAEDTWPISLDYDVDKDDWLLAHVAALERASEHPLANALVQASEEKGLTLAQTGIPEVFAGRGLVYEDQGLTWVVGNVRLMDEQGISVSSATKERIDQLSDQGSTVVMVGLQGQLVALLGISDPIKSDSSEAIARLKKAGVRVIMMTGDSERTAQAVAAQTGIDEVIAGVMPAQKSDKVRALQAQGLRVGMVGDGINDAPALAQANVGFAIGTGTDVAIESADITLMRGSLQGVADAMMISRATLRNIHQNLFGAFIYNSLGIPLAAGVLFPLLGWLMNPAYAAAAMALSSVTVVSNANRLRLMKLD
ncbi:HAD-IC family P-type ATPase [Nitrincola nitratireducens]|uniref:Copper-exporting P-type ATPase A n=1 Tax=Nitrincola nitratireducens TaxID=1229521 RepID=W9VKE1_9GAMM|nr:HAD-IC family P-type ATPase [Nitrincola nitratireducens]EXJ11010.1 Copper-exporting P-type ATPase A [Nitrincola nitratireducens]